MNEKVDRLKRQMEVYAREDVVVAFSGGVDSSILLKLACEAAQKTGNQVYGVFLQTKLHPSGECEEARAAAEEMGAKFRVLKLDELDTAGIGENPIDRCYRCKKYLFQSLLREAEVLRAGIVLEGTNEDDLHVYRPGIRAVRELGILSPLADAGLGKAEVRRLAKERGIAAAKKPSTPCLATRFPYGTTLSYEEMERVDQAERYLRDLGFYNVRVRVHGEIARIEVDIEDLEKVIENREMITERIKALGYPYVTLDLEGFRSGSMDIKNAAGGI